MLVNGVNSNYVGKNGYETNVTESCIDRRRDSE